MLVVSNASKPLSRISYPKSLDANTLFRGAILDETSKDTIFAKQVYDLCRDDILFWINTFCIAEGTRVVTDRGLVPIQSVTPEDKVWDGDEWVSQGGALFQGHKSVIIAYGIKLTPEHKVWTKHGWKCAIEGYDRAEIRLPEGYSSKHGFEIQGKKGVLALPVRVWSDNHSGREQFAGRKYNKLRMREKQISATNNTRNEQRSNLYYLDVNESQVLQSEVGSVQTIWRTRNQCVRTLEKVREFLFGHGRENHQNPDLRACEQRRELRAWKRPVGFSERTGKQHAESIASNSYKNFTRVIETTRNSYYSGSELQRHTGENQKWRDGGRPVNAEPQTQKVYDLLNCGPKKAFTVIDENGKPLLVHNCWTKDTRVQDSPTLPFITYEFQDEYILEIQKAILEGYDLLTEKSRDMGASWCVLYVLQHFFQFSKGCDFLVGSRKEELVDKLGVMNTLLEKVRFNLKLQPAYLLAPKFLNEFEDRTAYLRLTSPSQQNAIIGESTGVNFGTGGRSRAVVLDEFARVESGIDEATWGATADVSPCRLVLSTPVGAANKYAQLALGTDEQIKKVTLHWTLHPEKSKGTYYLSAGQRIPIDTSKDYKAAFKVWLHFGRKPGIVRSPWYDAEAARRTAQDLAQEVDISYHQSGSPFFNLEALATQVPWTYHQRHHPGDEIPHGRHIRINLLEIGGRIEIREQEDGWLRLYEFPKDSYQYALGGDSAEGLAKGDEAFGVCRDKSTNHVVADFNGLYDPDEFALKLRLLGWYFNECENAPENNNHGYSTIHNMLALDHVNMYYSRNDKKEVTQKAGFTTNARTRPLMLDLMATQVDKFFFEIRSEIILAQCQTFIKNPNRGGKPEADGSFKDDGIIACAIAGYVIEEIPFKMMEHKKTYIQSELVTKRLAKKNAGFSFR